MLERIVECVPNFSEGRELNKINAVVEAVKGVKGVKVLDVNFDPDYNRTVISFIGDPEAVKQAAFNATKKAIELIDLREQKGVHPRLGAMDVVPFVPVKNVSMNECVQLAKELGKEIGEKIGVPVYLYGEAASCPERRNLSFVRKGEFEALKEKLKGNEWKPDFGPAELNETIAKAGAVAVGARNFLIAFNVDLETQNKRVAEEIAKKVRASEKLKGVKALGVFLESRKLCQVSMNVTMPEKVSLELVFKEVKRSAKEFNVIATGFEVVGLTPEQVLKAAKHYAVG